MIEECDDIPIGTVLSMSLYTIYVSILDKLINSYKIDSRIITVIYVIPLFIFYIGTPVLLIPVLLRVSDKIWGKAR